MFLEALIFFVISQISLFSGFSYFWLAILAIFFFFTFRRKSAEELKKTSLLISLFIPFFFSFIFLRWLKAGFLWEEFFVLISVFFFGLFLKIFSAPDKKWKKEFLSIIPLLSPIFIALWFFYLSPLENLFWKEIFLFILTFIALKSSKYISEPEKEFMGQIMPELTIKKERLVNLISALIMLEMAWFLSFLPVNFLSLAAVWFLIFYLLLEFLNYFKQGCFKWKNFLFQTILIFILSLLILVSSRWMIV